MPTTPRRCCLIVTTPRTGSWVLAEALNATGLVGEPQEYFGWEVFEAWSEEFGLSTEAPILQFLEAAIAYGTTENGIFSAKMHWSQLGPLLKRLRAGAGDWSGKAGEVLQQLFPDLHCVHLYRADTARQAISFWRADHDRRWWDVGDSDKPRLVPAPDFQQIRWYEDYLVADDRKWQRLLERHDIPSISVSYEALVADRKSVLSDILKFLDCPDEVEVLPPPRLKRQADETTEEWLTAYRVVRDEVEPTPPAWARGAGGAGGGGIATETEEPPAQARKKPLPWSPTPLPPGEADRSTYGPAPELPWVLQYVVDENGDDSGWLALRGPLDAAERRLLASISQRRRVIGWTSYGTFPRMHKEFDGPGALERGLHGRERGYLSRCEGWVHCFRHPERYLPPGVPALLLSESDFVDPDEARTAAGGVSGLPLTKEWDVVYVCCPNTFNEVSKNWRLARRCLIRLADELGTSALLVGRHDAPDLPQVPGITAIDELPWGSLMTHLARSRVLLVAGVLDPSPRLIVEALSLDLPIVVNEQILGGWKYVRPETGCFFRDEHDVVDATRACLKEEGWQPHGWLVRNGGPERAERRLAAFLNGLGAAARRAPLQRAHLSGEIG